MSTAAVPNGLVSVMPQPCTTATPWRWTKARSIAGGQAAPPITVRFIVEKRRPCCSTWASSPCQTVGTPEDSVTPSASNSS
ncbi:hypothetical protein FQZ97_471800 [compost metagenome]